jgi:cytochrome c biogenesis protein CcmG/thiol:disulfide interchange protein DsbE
VKRWIGLAPIIVLIGLVVLFAGYALKHDPHVQPDALVGKPVPAVSLPDLDSGAMMAVRDTPPGPRLINFYASWCAPCRVEAPQLMALKARGVPVVGIAYKDDPVRTQAFLAELGDPFVAKLVDRNGRAGIEFGVTGVPETFLVGSDGVILAKHSGPLTDAAGAELMKKLR